MLELKNISKTFSNDSGFLNKVLDKVNLKVEKGEFVCIIGSNGTGKSTLLNIISGHTKETEGSIELNGKEINKLPEHIRTRNINRVFQNPSMGTCPTMSVRENLAMAMKKESLFGLKKCLSFREDVYRKAIEEFSPRLLNHIDTPVGSLSGGQRQSISLLMSSLSEPDILLLDEHTAALDPKTSDEIIELTDKIVRDRKITTLMVTHNLKHAINYGDRIIMLHKGNIIMDVRGEEKKNLTAEIILKSFEYAV